VNDRAEPGKNRGRHRSVAATIIHVVAHTTDRRELMRRRIAEGRKKIGKSRHPQRENWVIVASDQPYTNFADTSVGPKVFHIATFSQAKNEKINTMYHFAQEVLGASLAISGVFSLTPLSHYHRPSLWIGLWL